MPATDGGEAHRKKQPWDVSDGLGEPGGLKREVQNRHRRPRHAAVERNVVGWADRDHGGQCLQQAVSVRESEK